MSRKIPAWLSEYLLEKANLYNAPRFIETDPVSIPHRYTKKEDIEIAGLLTATIAWGNRKAIIQGAGRMMQLMQDSPHAFVMHHTPRELAPAKNFVYRTFNGGDFIAFIKALQKIYTQQGGLEKCFATQNTICGNISGFSQIMHGYFPASRTNKHVSDPLRGSSAKRLNMFLRWMVRKDNKGVDFGIWKSIKPSQLMIPLDVHSGNTARQLGLLQRKQNDWKSVEELTAVLRKIHPRDPVLLDFALFGIGAFEKGILQKHR